jgi:hypothetical protein
MSAGCILLDDAGRVRMHKLRTSARNRAYAGCSASPIWKRVFD